MLLCVCSFNGVRHYFLAFDKFLPIRALGQCIVISLFRSLVAISRPGISSDICEYGKIISSHAEEGTTKWWGGY